MQDAPNPSSIDSKTIATIFFFRSVLIFCHNWASYYRHWHDISCDLEHSFVWPLTYHPMCLHTQKMRWDVIIDSPSSKKPPLMCAMISSPHLICHLSHTRRSRQTRIQIRIIFFRKSSSIFFWFDMPPLSPDWKHQTRQVSLLVQVRDYTWRTRDLKSKPEEWKYY